MKFVPLIYAAIAGLAGCGETAASAAKASGPAIEQLVMEDADTRIEADGYMSGEGFVFHGRAMKSKKIAGEFQPQLEVSFQDGTAIREREFQQMGESGVWLALKPFRIVDRMDAGLFAVEFSQAPSADCRFSIKPTERVKADDVMGRFLPDQWPDAKETR